MSPVFAARRRAQEFDDLVEGTSTGDVDATRYADLVALVSQLRAMPEPEARPEFVADLRAQLMVAARTELSPAAGEVAAGDAVRDRLTLPAPRTSRDRRLAVAVGGLAIVGATSSMAVASQSALPGDALYPLKRAIENAQTGFRLDDGDKGTSLLASARGRLDEVDQLSRDGQVRHAEELAAIESTLADFQAQAQEASDLLLTDFENTGQESSVVELKQFTSESLGALDQLEAVLPPEAEPALVAAGTLLAQIQQSVTHACPTCDGPGLSEVPAWLLQAASTTLDDGTRKLLEGLEAAGAPEVPGAGAAGKTDGSPGPSGKGSGTGPDQGSGKGDGGSGSGLPEVVVTPGPDTGSGQGDGGSGDDGQGAGLPGDQSTDLPDGPVKQIIKGLLGGGKDDGKDDGKGSGSGGSGSGSGQGGTGTSASGGDVGEVVEDVVEGVGEVVGGVLGGLAGGGSGGKDG